MLLRPARVVRVSTIEDLDAALSSADQVIVEGDDALLSYAATKAAKDPGLTQIDVHTPQIEVGGVLTGRGGLAHPPATPSPPMAICSAFPKPFGVGGPPTKSSTRRHRLSFLVAATIIVVAVGVSGWMLVGGHNLVPVPAYHVATEPKTAPGKTDQTPDAPPTPTEKPDAASVSRPTREKVATETLQSLAWPVVAIVAIVALFLTARQAIAGGRNVEIAWKVTEKVSGRLVITKVQTKSRARSAA